jgi:hypothetical protein
MVIIDGQNVIVDFGVDCNVNFATSELTSDGGIFKICNSFQVCSILNSLHGFVCD